jgi:aminomethyltransferase
MPEYRPRPFFCVWDRMTAAALRRTPLTAAHRMLGARMVDFAGWEMPLHYGSQVEEHRAVRNAAGVFDVSHMLVVDISGSGARAYLRRLLANDVAKLKTPGKALYSCLLNEAGGVLDDLITYWRGDEHFRLVLNAGTAEKDCAWLNSRNETATVRIEPRRDLAILAVQGPRAREKTWNAVPAARSPTAPLAHFEAAEAGELFIARTGYTGEDGFEIVGPGEGVAALWSALVAEGVVPAGLGARDTLRLEAGMNLYGQDMDETVTPEESGLAWTVALDEAREFIGRQALESKMATQRLLGLVLIDKGVMRGHQNIRSAGGAGAVTSGGFSPTLNRSIALARVPRTVAPDDEVEVEVRGNWMRARAVKPPFVRHGKVLVTI